MGALDSLTGSIRELTTKLSAEASPDSAARGAVEIAMNAVDAAGATLYLHDGTARELRFYYAIGRREGKQPAKIALGLANAAMPDDKGIVGEVFQTCRPLITNDAEFSPRRAREVDEDFGFTTRNLATVPLCHPDGSPFGVLQALNKRGGGFVELDLATLQVLADILAMALYIRGQRLSER